MEVIGKHKDLNKGELKVLDWIEKGLSNIDGTILVEPPLRRTNKNPYWPDFIIISPTHGICILECKSFESAKIRSISSVEELCTNDEVIRYKLQLRNYSYVVSKLLNDSSLKLHKCVIFPLIAEIEQVVPELHKFNEDAKDISLLFRDHMNWDATLDILIGEPLPKKLNSKEMKELLRHLNPIRVFDHNIALDMDPIHNQLKIFDNHQMNIIDSIKEGHYIINGLPGTGKTKMLESIAERELAKGKKVLFTCFNKLLLNQVALELGNDVALTLSKLYYPLAQILGLSFKQRNWLQETKRLFATIKGEPYFDVILVDEYQDLEEEDYTILLSLLKSDGLLVLAGDQLQNITGNKETWKSKGINVASGRHRNFFLPLPYRTPPMIVDFALKFICRNENLKKVAERYFNEHNHQHRYGDFSGLTKVLRFIPAGKDGVRSEITDIIKKNPTAEILVITCNDDQVNDLGLTETAKIKVAPFRKVKGIEADIVVLYNIDFFKKWNPSTKLEEKMKMVFSALCRSRGLLYINGYRPEDFYEDLHELYLDCLTRRNEDVA